MKIAVIQMHSLPGDVDVNLRRHARWADLAADHGAQLIIFPELSLTGYEPALAKQLAVSLSDSCFDILDDISARRGICIGAGMPVQTAGLPMIAMLLFQSGGRRLYGKQYLHADELPYFSAAGASPALEIDGKTIALAICYELSVPAHETAAFQSGAALYIASVAKSAAGMEKAATSLAAIAQAHNCMVLVANNTGPCDNFTGTGWSAAWSSDGRLLARLDDEEEAMLMVDYPNGQVSVVHGKQYHKKV